MAPPHQALADARPAVLWLDDPARPPASAPLRGASTADLVVVGGGYAGLWTALRALERDPGRDVVVIEAGRCGDQASGRNGGFASASLTHGVANGRERWGDELPELERLGAQNLRDIGETVRRHDIDCRWEETGELTVATASHHLEELGDLAAAMRSAGRDAVMLDGPQVRGMVRSPSYLGGLLDPKGTALVEPARLAWGLRDVGRSLGARVHEDSPVTGLRREAGGVEVRTRTGTVLARQVVLATNAFPSLLRRLRLMTVPVYDYVLATEPLSPAQLNSVGWSGRQGVGDAGNLFHYYRLTRENRIVWGGYDAVYHYGSRIHRDLEQRDATHGQLAEHFFATFPQLSDVRFTHRWGGVIDTSTQFAAFYGTAYDGLVAYALGYTGLGVAATRFAADVALDLLGGEDTERTRLRMVRERPLPFPPEPLRFAGVQLTRWSLSRADGRAGHRNLWLRALDRMGLGFDS